MCSSFDAFTREATPAQQHASMVQFSRSAVWWLAVGIVHFVAVMLLQSHALAPSWPLIGGLLLFGSLCCYGALHDVRQLLRLEKACFRQNALKKPLSYE